MILDIGPQDRGEACRNSSRRPAPSSGTARSACSSSISSPAARKAIAAPIAASKAFSIAGGGDTLAAIAKFGIADKMSYISTGGGAFLEFLEGRKLPAVEMLEQRARKLRTPGSRLSHYRSSRSSPNPQS